MPRCETKTNLRKLSLVIHLEGFGLVLLGKTCRLCLSCETLIAHKAELDTLLNTVVNISKPEYIVLGTVDRRTHRLGLAGSASLDDVRKHASDFKIVSGTWNSRQQAGIRRANGRERNPDAEASTHNVDPHSRVPEPSEYVAGSRAPGCGGTPTGDTRAGHAGNLSIVRRGTRAAHAQLDDGRIANMEITEKQRAIAALRALPEHATIEDAIERLCFIAKIEEGLRQSDARQLVSHDEVKKQFLS